MKTRINRFAWLTQIGLWTMPVLLAAALALPGCDNEDRVGADAEPVAADTTATPPARNTAVATDDATVAAGEVPADQQQRQTGSLAVQTAREGDSTRQFIMFPTGQRETSVLMIENVGPAEVRAGQPYDYQIKLTNLTDAPLAGVRLRQSLPHGLSIESAQPAVSQMVNAPPTTRPSSSRQQQGQQQAQAQGQQQQPNQQDQQQQENQQQASA